MSRFSFGSMLSFATLLSISSAMAQSPTETWSYENCFNLDGVEAKPDSSMLWVSHNTDASVSITWKTSLLGGDDEKAKTNAGGDVIEPVTMEADAHPVSATWKLTEMALVSRNGESLTWTANGYPIIGDSKTPSTIPGKVSYTESVPKNGKKPIRSITLTQEFQGAQGGTEVWTSSYTPFTMTRLETYTDASSATSSQAMRTCTANAAPLVRVGF